MAEGDYRLPGGEEDWSRDWSSSGKAARAGCNEVESGSEGLHSGDGWPADEEDGEQGGRHSAGGTVRTIQGGSEDPGSTEGHGVERPSVGSGTWAHARERGRDDGGDGEYRRLATSSAVEEGLRSLGAEVQDVQCAGDAKAAGSTEEHGSIKAGNTGCRWI